MLEQWCRGPARVDTAAFRLQLLRRYCRPVPAALLYDPEACIPSVRRKTFQENHLPILSAARIFDSLQVVRHFPAAWQLPLLLPDKRCAWAASDILVKWSANGKGWCRTAAATLVVPLSVRYFPISTWRSTGSSAVDISRHKGMGLWLYAREVFSAFMIDIQAMQNGEERVCSLNTVCTNCRSISLVHRCLLCPRIMVWPFSSGRCEIPANQFLASLPHHGTCSLCFRYYAHSMLYVYLRILWDGAWGQWDVYVCSARL